MTDEAVKSESAVEAEGVVKAEGTVTFIARLKRHSIARKPDAADNADPAHFPNVGAAALGRASIARVHLRLRIPKDPHGEEDPRR